MLSHLKELQSLDLPKGSYAIFGSGPIAVRNIRDSRDIDIIVKSSLWNELTEEHGEYIKQKPTCIKIDNIEIYPQWLSLSEKIDEMIASAEIIQGLPFVKLEYVLQWKKSMGRDKDKRDIKLINQYLENKSS